ncbi:MAG TPA: hypothetical protein ENJ84_15380 [Gammaproteobacteria bacterium]|nr:hypothetical protein [Gammaproteobacteria bacterium]
MRGVTHHVPFHIHEGQSDGAIAPGVGHRVPRLHPAGGLREHPRPAPRVLQCNEQVVLDGKKKPPKRPYTWHAPLHQRCPTRVDTCRKEADPA